MCPLPAVGAGRGAVRDQIACRQRPFRELPLDPDRLASADRDNRAAVTLDANRPLLLLPVDLGTAWRMLLPVDFGTAWRKLLQPRETEVSTHAVRPSGCARRRHTPYD